MVEEPFAGAVKVMIGAVRSTVKVLTELVPMLPAASSCVATAV